MLLVVQLAHMVHGMLLCPSAYIECACECAEDIVGTEGVYKSFVTGLDDLLEVLGHSASIKVSGHSCSSRGQLGEHGCTDVTCSLGIQCGP